MTATDKLSRARERTRLVVDAVQSFALATTDPARLLQVIVRGTAETLGGFCAVALLSDDGTALVPAAAWDADPHALALMREVIASMPTPIDSSLPAAEVVRTGQPYLQREGLSAGLRSRIGPERWDAVDALKVRSALVVALRNQGKALGFVTFLRRGEAVDALDEEDVQVAQALADHAALAITNARMFEALEREVAEGRRMRDRLDILSEAARHFAAATTDLHQLLDVIAQRLAETIGDLCSIRLVTADGLSFDDERTSIFHTDPAVLAPAVRMQLRGTLRVREGLLSRVVASGESLLLARVDAAQLLAVTPVARRPDVELLQLRSIIAAPVVARGSVIGAVTLSRTGDGRPPYTTDDLGLLEDIATHAGLAIGNSALLEQANRELAERRRAEAALTEFEHQLRQAQKMEAVGRLAGGIAHDFNNLLSVVLSYTGLLLEDLAPADPKREDLVQIRMAGERAADLTRQLLAFGRRQIIAPQILDLNGVVASMDRMIRRIVSEDIELRTKAATDLGKVKADPGHVEQVLMNLVVNACDAMPEGGRLTIETGNVDLDEAYAKDNLGVVPGRHVMVAVSDTGTGMTKEVQEQIFEPFFTTKEVGRGSGLGLSTVFGIVKQGGGSIWVHSVLGEGTTFKVYFPQTDEVGVPPPVSFLVETVRGTETVLLVEDDDQLRAVAREILEKKGYRVLEAQGGFEALALCDSYARNIHLLLTDVVMPQMSGKELARRLVPLRPDLRVLYMSGYTPDAILHNGILDPGVALLQKPITPERLLRRVRAELDRPVSGSAPR